MVELSVIIPTYNRAGYLKDVLVSVLGQSLNRTFYEIIVVNNGSSDNAKNIVAELNQEYGHRICYFSEPPAGLHNGRHRGAKESCGDILVYVDDDIIAFPEWLEAIREAFRDSEVALVGGKNLPKWEGERPVWINLFWIRNEYGICNGYLSLLDFGEGRKEISADFVYGCNFSIRKKVMYECGGFHPDSMPRELIRFRGDGESGLSRKLMEKGYRAVYEPKAVVYHRITAERLTVQYFCQRAFNQGVSDSYAQIRRLGQRGVSSKKWPRIFLRLRLKGLRQKAIFGLKSLLFKSWHPIMKKVKQAYEEGYHYHQEQVRSDPELLAHVLKKVYY